jgi:putative PIN family toxin of toxin-antitoxin system
VRVVIDTNVLVSGIINPHAPPGRILDTVLSESVAVLHDDRILSEYREVLLRPIFAFSTAVVDTVLNFIATAGEPIVAGPLEVALPDPTDLPFLEVAVAGSADALITGNLRHFMPRRGRHNVSVCLPAEFLKRIALR